MQSVAYGGTFFETSQSPIVSEALQPKRHSTFSILTRRFESSHNAKMNEQILEMLSRLDNSVQNLSREVAGLDNKVAGLHNEVGGLRNEVGGLRYDLNKTNGTIAKQAANQFTVELMGDDEDPPFGHGILLKDSRGEDNKYAVLLTAAHIALDAREYFRHGRFKKVRFLNGKEYFIANEDTFQLELYFQDSYIIDGTGDYAGVRLMFREVYHNAPQAALVISQDQAFGSEFYGRTANVNFRSNAIAVENKDRVRLSAPSRKGCSGTPLFSPAGELLSILHGEDKHRAKLHSSSTESDGNLKATDEMSPIVYVDIVKSIGHLKLWGRDLFGVLWKLENLDDKETKDPSQRLYKSHLSCSGEEAGEEKRVAVSFKAMEFFNKVVELFPLDSQRTLSAFNKDYFTLEEVCTLLVNLHDDQSRANSDSPVLADSLVPNGDLKYMAYVASQL